ncbi:MAG: alpha/beta hydrolase [Lachnospiraceae bacterium]|nr:alpha/beta hydrolase [Lachnospiraceae bacterium]
MMIKYYEVISSNHVLRGMIHEGKNKIPIILVHGYFSSNKIGPHRLYFQIADILNRLGYTILRIDLSGMGESDGNIERIEFDDHVNDLLIVTKALMEYKKSDYIHYIGHCVGCCNVLKSVINRLETVKSITLISPFMPSEHKFVDLLLGEENYKRLMNEGIIYRKGLACKKSFIDAGYLIDDKVIIEQCNRRNLEIFLSEKDELVDLQESIEWTKRFSLSSKIIDEADHNFINLEARRRLLIMLRERFVRLKND